MNWLVNPGSQEAIDRGCTCPIMDNRWGKGWGVDEDGMPIFVIQDDCPLHNLPSVKEDA